MRTHRPLDAEDPVIPSAWFAGEVAVLGLARTGVAVCEFLTAQGVRVYASDHATGDPVAGRARHVTSQGVTVQLGGHDLPRIARAAAVIVSPGVPPDAPPVVAAREAGVPVLAELELAARMLPETSLVVVTGTNGKSTTTALTAHLLRTGGLEAVPAGNIGRPLITLASEPAPPPWAVVEASSFQLHDWPGVRPAVGVVTNLSPDHLDRYATVEAYYADKRLLFRNAQPNSRWVLNGDEGDVLALAAGAAGARRCWSVRGQADGWWDRSSDTLMLGTDKVAPRAALRLLGEHNVANALAAMLVAGWLGVATADIADGIASFRGLPHRLETVRDLEGVRWINDSKATNVAAARVAIAAMTTPYVLIMGGRGKGEAFDTLAEHLEGCRAVVTFGEAGDDIVAALGGAAAVRRVQTLADAVHEAHAVARAGDAVLLAPACASFDQFTDFAHRGDTFRRLVLEL